MFAGENIGEGSNCYAIGNFELVEKYTSTKSKDGYTIITDKDLAKKKSTYAQEFWDSGLWNIDEDVTYPYLKYFNRKLN